VIKLLDIKRNLTDFITVDLSSKYILYFLQYILCNAGVPIFYYFLACLHHYFNGFEIYAELSYFCTPRFFTHIALNRLLSFVICYFPKATLQKMWTCYYATLFKLFKFDFTDFDANTINDFLKNYGLFAFQHRVFVRLSLFTYKALSDNAPPILYGLITTSADTELISDATSNTSCTKRVFNLRSGQKMVLSKPVSKYAKISFSSIFTKVKNKCITPYFNLNLLKFKNNICTNINFISNELCNIFQSFLFLSYRKFNFAKKKSINMSKNNN